MKNLYRLSCSDIKIQYFNKREKILLSVIDGFILSYKEDCIKKEKTTSFLYHRKNQIDSFLLTLFFMGNIKFPLHVRLPYLVEDNSESIIYHN